MSSPHPSSSDRAALPSAASPTGAAPLDKARLVRWLIGLPVAFFAVLMLLGAWLGTPESEARWAARETIRLCWKAVGKAPAAGEPVHFSDPAQCERLEFDFKTQYGTHPSTP